MENKEKAPEKPDISILMLGLDEAGKTTLLYKQKLGIDELKTIPTIGYNVETVEFEEKNYTFWDIGGLAKVRCLWKFYKENVKAVVFVIDASTPERLPEAKDFLHSIMSDEDLHDAKLLVVSNKQDKLNCIADKDLEKQLDLNGLRQPSVIVVTSALDRPSINKIMVSLRDMDLF